MAQQALKQGDARLAVTLARGLLQADPTDSHALIVLAQGLEAQGQHSAGRRAAAQAFRAADAAPDRFMAAQIAARNAYAGGQFELAKYWLRRSLDPAPTDRLRAQAEADFKRVRADSPWATQLRVTIEPSDNVNAGTDNPYLVVDGLTVYGTHSPSAMALSGVTTRIEATTAYRLWQSDNATTHIIGQISRKHVTLSESSRAAAAGITGADLSSTLAEIGLSHRMAAPGGAKAAGIWGISGKLGQVWHGGDPSYSFAKGTVSRSVPLHAGLNFRMQGSYEYRVDRDAALSRSDHLQLRGDLTGKLAHNRSFAFGLILDQTDSDRGNVTAMHKTAYASYGLGELNGLIDLRLSVGARQTDYPRYFIGALAAPGGRQDDSIFAALDITLTEVSYGGFVPRISLSAERSRSNISRFETRATALSLGIESKF